MSGASHQKNGTVQWYLSNMIVNDLHVIWCISKVWCAAVFCHRKNSFQVYAWYGYAFLAWCLASTLCQSASYHSQLVIQLVTQMQKRQLNNNKPSIKSNWGIDEWTGDCLPAEKYEYVCSVQTDTESWASLAEVEDEAVQEILKWYYQNKVLMVPGAEIVYEEELRYIVCKSEHSSLKEWSVQITVFDVRLQQECVFSFRLGKWRGVTSNSPRKKNANVFVCYNCSGLQSEVRLGVVWWETRC